LSANGDEAKTMRLPAAAVFVGTADAQPAEHRLAALNYLGRAEENQIRVTQPGVSRRHALILVTPKGYTIRDLGSQNGTFVNGSRITESALADGDTIDIGSARIIFRSPWPGASAER
jgi:pSer/pThr/pTyr-binding forkhead associated (FHA) protein